ncbi:phenylalanine--tRNA ligase subunit beta [Aliidiomarina halalkaliphila]|uniref:Phenylalanine--tRNA ligase beta subunit n=1 Tax=Aliidiomarina halalkaliphila TaxID=2593535 RepID=A0A552X490_9GAMM|nr:phenylalanine--tRNA ligase subunit beta [Aliidiomarina halalkaliphila]TRW49851.1 phenylalanine--tRNA ligase subunit beta [Aliidiomarina halalkaliphila]
MKFSEQWLREWVNPQLSTEALAEQLSMAGLEVDGVEPVAGEFTGVVVGQVVACEQHPNADKLRVTKVDIGADEHLDIVCGASNCRTGIKVAVATVGAVLPGDFKIKKSKLRGEPSHGMLCSSSELELSDEHDGILELPADAPIGEDFRVWLGLNDSTLDIDLTPNRADCLGVKGLAREVGVLNQLDVREPEIKAVASTINDQRAIHLKAPDGCPRYLGRVIRNLDVTVASPLWLQERLRRSGIRSIDPVVDVTNYVLLELGHPMHGFDLDAINGDVQVRWAQDKEQITLLDGQTVTLQDDVLLIADEQKPLAMAGIFGGEGSGVTSDTKHIFLESAFFAPDAIMGRARRFGLHTDASHRYERGVDPELQATAMERATALILSICGGEAGPIVEAKSSDHLPKPAQITLRASRLTRLLGISVPAQDVENMLARLGFAVTKSAEGWEVVVPTYRFDIAIEEDLIEEVARVYGYNNIPTEAPQAALRMQRTEESEVSLRVFKQSLMAQGYQEAITYSFVDPKHQALLYPELPALTLPHPISVDMSSMRLGLWPGLLAAAGYNQKRQQPNVRLFESGLRFVPDAEAENGIRQEPMLAGVITGSVQGEHWADGTRPVDFYDVKGHVERLLAVTGAAHEFRFVAEAHTALHPGQSAGVYRGDTLVGFVGGLHPQYEKTFGIKGRAFVFELALNVIRARGIPTAGVISRYPSIRRDIAIVVDQQVLAGNILESIRKVGANQLVDLNLFDVYTGANLPENKKSLAIALTLQAADRTLEDSEVNALMETVVQILKDEFNAVLRDS